MFPFSISKSANITRLFTEGERARDVRFYAGSVLAIISQGGFLYVALKKSDELVLPSIVIGFIGVSLVISNMHKLKEVEENQEVVDNGVFRLIIPPEEANWALNTTNIGRSFRFLADDYNTFWTMNSREIGLPPPDYKLEFTKALIDGLVDIAKIKISPLHEEHPDKMASFVQLDLELVHNLKTVKKNFANDEKFNSSALDDVDCWSTLFFDVFDLLKKWVGRYETLVE